MKKNCLLLVLILAGLVALAQTQNGFATNGNGVKDAGCSGVLFSGIPNPINHTMYTKGSVWYRHPIDLDLPFELGMVIDIYKTIATDGMAFVLATDSTALGKNEHYMGWGGMDKSIAVTFDMKPETLDNDPPYNHIAIQANGITDHQSSANIAGPVAFEPAVDNGIINKYVTFKWEPASKTFTITSGNAVVLSVQYDIINNIFNGQHQVYWGFTASQTQLELMHTIPPDARPPLGFLHAYFGLITPGYSSSPSLDTCFGSAVSFFDNSLYLSNGVFNSSALAHWFWDFGDGTTSTLRNPPPHQYSSAGQYNLKFAITNQIGCTLDTLVKKITLASLPTANFNYTAACTVTPLLFKDSSAAAVTNGIFYWRWNFNSESSSDLQNPVVTFNSTGVKTISLKVRTAEGCEGTVSKLINIKPAPVIDFSYTKDCDWNYLYNGIVQNSITVSKWYWDFGDHTIATGNTAAHTFTANGQYDHTLYAVSIDGCVSDTIEKQITVNKIIPSAGADTVVAEDQPLQLNATGADRYKWFPSTGLSNPAIANPVALLHDFNQQYIVEFRNSDGCKAYDTINIKVFKNIDVFVPGAFSPNGDGINDLLHFTTPGFKRIEYFKIFNRSGNLLFTTNSYHNAWDGTYKGEPLSPGAYVWIMKGEDYLGNAYIKKGSIMLLR